jgi:hypothetical protein
MRSGGRTVQWKQTCKSGPEDLWKEEYRARHPVTDERWIMGWGRVERDATGHAVRMVGINFDITDASV